MIPLDLGAAEDESLAAPTPRSTRSSPPQA